MILINALFTSVLPNMIATSYVRLLGTWNVDSRDWDGLISIKYTMDFLNFDIKNVKYVNSNFYIGYGFSANSFINWVKCY